MRHNSDEGMPMYRVGFDVGGTFTDFTLLNETDGSLHFFKVPSTPDDPSRAIEAGLAALTATVSLDPTACAHLGHGTTVATNLVIERKGARTGLITTRGTRDVLEIGRQTRPHLYDDTIRRPPPLIPRDLRIEVDERILYDGRVVTPLDEGQVERAARQLGDAGVEAVVICFLHSYRRPDHERQAGRIVRRILPGAYVTLSSDVLPEFREFERLSTTVLNGFIGPRMGTYLERLQGRLDGMGIGAPLDTIHSNGGLMSVATVREVPVRTCVSGPAAGVVGAVAVGRGAGFADLVTFDVGGTSTDVSVVAGGQPRFAGERHVADYPVKTPMIDIHVIGAGGGSIAALDDSGALTVGPRSAGAVPGPVAYGLGGEDPTLTDANIVLGRLDPGALLDGRLAVDSAAARRAIEQRIARPLGIGVEEAAFGILRIANANMGRAIRAVSTERGYDVRDFALFAYGGAGPLHACDLAADCAFRTVLVPQEPGTLCARGILLSDISMDFVRSELALADPGTWRRACATLAEMEREATAWLDREGVEADRRTLHLMIDARYDGQNFEVVVPLDRTDPDGLDEMVRRFRRRHQQENGYDVDGRPVEIVNCRVKAVGRAADRPPRPPSPRAGLDPVKGRRRVYFGPAHGWLDTVVWRRGQLPAGADLAGPAIVEEMSATLVIPPHHRARVDAAGNLIVTIPATETLP